ncbi:MAG TPA: hypothetical protein VMB48_07620, partial [Steroidobacteraceae bacterium]|nr:hypothetical protein [Steroidobacteraceae bacterium]
GSAHVDQPAAYVIRGFSEMGNERRFPDPASPVDAAEEPSTAIHEVTQFGQLFLPAVECPFHS